MRLQLSSVSISRQLLVLGLVAALPSLVALFFIVSGFNKDLDFAADELRGIAYIRPLDKLLRLIPEHRRLANKGTKDGPAKEIDAAMQELQAADKRHGVRLQFTPEGLRKRKREHFQVTTLLGEWHELRNTNSQDGGAKHLHLIADVRAMIAHAGDTSNLILDPDLDSYYLMDAVVVSIPQAQDRLPSFLYFSGPKDRTKLAISAALLKESDVERTAGDVATALNEDENFHGISPTLKSNLAGRARNFEAANQSLLTAVDQATTLQGDPAQTDIALDASVSAALAATHPLWDAAASELELLLKARVAAIEKSRILASAATLIALALAVVLAFFIGKSITRTLRVVSGQLSSQSGNIRSAAEQISQSAESLAQSSSTQAASLEESSAALHEIESMAQQNAQATQSAALLTVSAKGTVAQGLKDLSAMQEIVKGSNKASENISGVIKTIDKIAFQTNILALNASVEAARAGEAGMGFAVVADAVRTLSQQSTRAATESAVHIENSVKASSQAAASAMNIGDSFHLITNSVEQVDKLVTSIYKGVLEESRALGLITKSILKIEQTTQCNAAAAEQSSAAVMELNRQALDIDQSIQQLQKLVG